MNYRYQNIDTSKQQSTGELYYINNIYPEIPVSNNDDYLIATLGDRLDLLALDFYGDVALWWIIASANSLPGDSLYLEPGTQIRIPANLIEIMNNYKVINILR
jgi:hypothetical protein